MANGAPEPLNQSSRPRLLLACSRGNSIACTRAAWHLYPPLHAGGGVACACCWPACTLHTSTSNASLLVYCCVCWQFEAVLSCKTCTAPPTARSAVLPPFSCECSGVCTLLACNRKATSSNHLNHTNRSAFKRTRIPVTSCSWEGGHAPLLRISLIHHHHIVCGVCDRL